MNESVNITIVGMGYVGLSMAVLLSVRNNITAVDISKDRVDKINNRISPIDDEYIIDYFYNKELSLKATTESDLAYKGADYVIVAVPTDYNEKKDYFDTSIVDIVIKDIIKVNKKCVIVIKSTVPVGYTAEKISETGFKNIIFMPEFLRESRALYDNLYPSRIIAGGDFADEKLRKKTEQFVDLLVEGAKKDHINKLYMGSGEAESVKLFSNTYLALRVSFFNELDTYSEIKSLNTEQIINGVCMDPRIGDFYNNPSFGYGGYCLPKDTKQLLANYREIPEKIIGAVVESNQTRMDFICGQIIKKIEEKSGMSNTIIGIYRLSMKSNSDNYRESSVLGIISRLLKKNINIVIYEPLLCEKTFMNCVVLKDMSEFKKTSDIIIANRYNSELDDVKVKVYTKDLYNRD